MNNTTQIAIVVRGRVIDTLASRNSIDAERYKAAARQWGRENRVVVNVMTMALTAHQNERHWLLPARAC
ncbi:MAG TPA: hypothetical protein VMR52_07245 [Dehalococcoidia bacterium]|nr:hypothetical protein [Dehalococcoidia bacterium]